MASRLHARNVAGPLLIPTRQVAQLLGISPARVRELVAAGQLQPVRFTERGRLRFRLADILEFVNAGDTARPGGPSQPVPATHTTKRPGGLSF